MPLAPSPPVGLITTEGIVGERDAASCDVQAAARTGSAAGGACRPPLGSSSHVNFDVISARAPAAANGIIAAQGIVGERDRACRHVQAATRASAATAAQPHAMGRR